MMLPVLADIADSLNLTFLWGEKEAFNVLADQITPESIVLYHEGYIAGNIAEDAQGAFEPSYTMKLMVLVPSALANTPTDRMFGFTSIEDTLYRVLRKLSIAHTLSNINIVEGINLTDRNMDGVRLSVTAKPKIPASSLC